MLMDWSPANGMVRGAAVCRRRKWVIRGLVLGVYIVTPSACFSLVLSLAPLPASAL